MTVGGAVVALLLGGCAGHADRTLKARNALDAGAPQQALQLINEELDVSSAEAVPADLGDDKALLLLDRAMILQQTGHYKLSSRDLQMADKQIEVLDLSRNAGDELGKYLFSDDAGPYRAPAYEKLLLNTMNIVNYLARGDLNGARIEARRLAVMQSFIERSEDPGDALLGPGSYLAGFAFEKSGRYQEALRYYDEALQYGDYWSLHEPVRRLAALASYRSPRIRAILSEAAPESDPNAEDDSAELLVVLCYGRVPVKYAERVPIGLALTYASGAISPTNAARANTLAAQGLVTWVNYPELGPARGSYDMPSLAIDGRSHKVEVAMAVDRAVRKAWDEAKGTVVASAITRMISRVVAGEVVRRSASDSALGLLLSLGTQAAMTAADTPDTRSWATLPARIALARVRLPPGTHKVALSSRGVRKDVTVTLPARSWSAVNLTVLR